MLLAGLLLVLGGAGACGGSRIEAGVFYAAKGYRITLPASGWEVAVDGRADLELRRPVSRLGIVVNATCEGKALTRSLAVLARHLTFGIQDKEVLTQSHVVVAGHPAVRLVLRGRLDDVPVQVEAYVVKGERCVYDLAYVAPPAEFTAGAVEFRAFVGSLSGP